MHGTAERKHGWRAALRTMLGALLPGIRQIPPALTLAGGAVVLTGVYIAARGTVSTDKTTA